MIIEDFLPQIASFLFVFAVIYGLLSSVKLFGEQNNRVSVLIALIIAFFAIMYSPLVNIFYEFMPIAAIILVILFFVVFIKKLMLDGGGKDSLPIAVSLAVMLTVLGILWNRLGFSIGSISSENMLWIIGLAIVIILLFAVYSHKPDEKK
ncbi:MAG: hypothetical protein V1900_00025 [Candidatus Aenigmatarchaeota archaeon]